MTTAALPARQIRFAVLCDEDRLEKWQLECIEALQQLEGVNASLLIVREPNESEKRNPGRSTRRHRKGGLLWRLYCRAVLDRASPSTPLRPLPPALANLPVMRCSAEELETKSVLEEIGKLNLDFILYFGTDKLTGGILDVARHGVWAFHFGDLAQPQSKPPGFWEIYRRDPLTAAALKRLSNEVGADVILGSGVFGTNATSYVRNREQVLEAAATWPARICKNLEAVGVAKRDGAPHALSLVARQEPSNTQMLRFFTELVRGTLVKTYRWLFRHQIWQVGIIDAPVHQVAGLSGGKESPSIRWLPNPQGRFLADPFGVEQGGDDRDLLILAEDYNWATARGRISSVQVTDNRIGEPRLLFDLPYHMSYPFLFRHEGRLFCVPETNEAREVSLYVLDEQTSAWTKECVLVAGRSLADSTLIQWDDQWWLFATDVEAGQVLHLHAWLAPDLRGPWREHPANPVKTDIRSARPAGRPFVHEGSLYRPAQDCSRTYGGAVSINKVLCMTPNHYQEEIVTMVRPRAEWPVPDGLHTLCGVGERTIIDACREVFVFRALVAKVASKFERLRSAR